MWNKIIHKGKIYIEWERVCTKEDITKQFDRKQMILRRCSPSMNWWYSYKVFVYLPYALSIYNDLQY